jgi:hypothetical protein
MAKTWDENKKPIIGGMVTTGVMMVGGVFLVYWCICRDTFVAVKVKDDAPFLLKTAGHTYNFLTYIPRTLGKVSKFALQKMIDVTKHLKTMLKNELSLDGDKVNEKFKNANLFDYNKNSEDN